VRLSRIALAGNLLTAALCAWLIFRPQPYGMATLSVALLPIAAGAAVLLTRRRFRLLAVGDDPAGLFAVVILPCSALAFRALADVVMLDWRMSLAWLGGGLLLAVLAFAVDAKLPTLGRPLGAAGGLLLAGLLAPYAWGVAVLANVLLDRAPAEVYRTPVLGKQGEVGGRRYLRLADWGPHETENTVRVDAAVYAGLKAGDHACVQVRPGALRIAWVVVRPCR
jgi:hypothetical protein